MLRHTKRVFVSGHNLLFSRGREWSQAEIGNHSWLHRVNLGQMGLHAVRDEVLRAHDLISDCIGAEPVGFIAPAWATSARVVEALIELQYLYDTSVFPRSSFTRLLSTIFSSF